MIMYFDFRTYFRFLFLAFFRNREAAFKLTPKRALGLALFFLLFPVFEFFTAICLALDHLLFPGFRRQKIERPIFIVGPHRSGTTYLQRLMDRDDQFFTFRLWEIVFPSILQKKIIAWIGRIDRRLGHPILRGMRRREAKRMGKYYSDIHELSAFQPEEDDKIGLHTFSILALMWFVHPHELDWLLYFDERCPPRDKDRIMRFYLACVKRQAWFKGGGRTFLSKAPFHCMRIKAIREYFPDARIIYTLRNPLDAVPSMLDVARKYWEATSGLQDWRPHQEWLYQTIRDMYRYPLATIAQLDPRLCQVVVHNDLLLRPRDAIRAFYAKFDRPVSDAFDALLRQEDETQRAFRRKHRPGLQQFNLTEERIRADFDFVYAAYTFPD